MRENLDRQDGLRQQHADIRRSRMSCSASLRQVQDWTDGARHAPTLRRAGELQHKPTQAPLISREGVRWSVAVRSLIALALLLAAVLLAEVADLGTGSRTVTRLGDYVQTLENRNSQLREELAFAADGKSIRSEAVKLDLISSNGARTVRITAPQGEGMTVSSAAAAAENAELEGRMLSYVGD